MFTYRSQTASASIKILHSTPDKFQPRGLKEPAPNYGEQSKLPGVTDALGFHTAHSRLRVPTSTPDKFQPHGIKEPAPRPTTQEYNDLVMKTILNKGGLISDPELTKGTETKTEAKPLGTERTITPSAGASQILDVWTDIGTSVPEVKSATSPPEVKKESIFTDIEKSPKYLSKNKLFAIMAALPDIALPSSSSGKKASREKLIFAIEHSNHSDMIKRLINNNKLGKSKSFRSVTAIIQDALSA